MFQVEETKNVTDSSKSPLNSVPNLCTLPAITSDPLPSDISRKREQLILSGQDRWVNGTVIRYYFFDKKTDRSQVELKDGRTEWRAWTTSEEEKEVVRKAFALWKNMGIGLDFKEVKRRENAEIRIGFMQGDGSWSYLGQQALSFGMGERTMNFGWSLSVDDGLDTALHEVGHALGCPHEHQNPNSGIEWDEPELIRVMKGSPNFWDEEKTKYNILRKLDADKIKGSAWDQDSVMQYPFPPGLILKPRDLKVNGIQPKGGLSHSDKLWVTKFYPPLTARDYTRLEPGVNAALSSGEDQQRHFRIKPEKSDFYEFRTFGESDSIMVLFKQTPGGLRYVTSSDSKGEDRDTKFKVKLDKGKEYVLRIMIFYADDAKEHRVVML